MDKQDLLLEIGVEEIPARFLPPAIKQLEELMPKALTEAGLPYDKLAVYATPRRLAIIVEGLAAMQPDSQTEQKGPAKAAAYDADGNPTKALLGFCKGQQVEVADLVIKEINGNPYLFAHKKISGQSAALVLPKILSDIISKIYFPKPMRWGYEEMRFARPIHWLIALLGEQVLPLEIATVKAANISRGHRDLGSAQITIKNPAAYIKALEDNFVIVDQHKRRQIIANQIDALAASLGGKAGDDPELLTEVVFLVEYPTALAGTFDQKYLDLPQELIITPMREHQRYFPVHKEDGSLINKFITVRNGNDQHLATVAAGNENVLKARLADAEFFWNEDLKAKMSDWQERLSEIVFHEKIGTMNRKSQRIATLAAYIGQSLGYSEQELAQTAKAAALVKADLLSHVVYEFPELQGIMGEYYALAAKEDKIIAQAIREHYLPRFADDDLPQTKAGIALSLADRIDSLMGFLAVGILPSGSQDPYALRRAASGSLQIIAAHHLKLDIAKTTTKAYQLLAADLKEAADLDATVQTALNFYKQRLANFLSEADYDYDIIQALQEQISPVLYDSILKAQALADYRRRKGFGHLLAGFTRAANLLRSAEQKGELPAALKLDSQLFAVDAERILGEHLAKIEPTFAQAVKNSDYAQMLDILSDLAADIDKFFEDVMVMDKDMALRHNRLALLQNIVNLSSYLADLSKLVEK